MPFPETVPRVGLVGGAVRSVLVQGEVAPGDLQDLLANAGVEIQAASMYAFGATRVALFVGRKFFLRSNDRLGVVVLSAANGPVQRLDLSYAGGGSGLLGAQWGAGNDLEAQLYDGLVALLQERSMRFSDVAPTE